MNKRTRSAMMPLFLILGVLVLLLSACSSGSNPGEISSANSQAGSQSTSAPQVVVPTKPAASSSGQDIASMDACALFPGDVLAKALNVTLSDPKNTGTSFGGPDCTYGFVTNGSSSVGTQVYILNLLAPDLYDISVKGGLENPQPVEGLGDKALLGTRVGTKTYDLMVLKTSDIFVEVLGDDPSLVQKMAEYVLANR
jgi:hypothetical protein